VLLSTLQQVISHQRTATIEGVSRVLCM